MKILNRFRSDRAVMTSLFPWCQSGLGIFWITACILWQAGIQGFAATGLTGLDLTTGQVVTNYPPGLSNIVAVATGDTISMALRSDGVMISWTNGSSGAIQLGPVMSGIASISARGANVGYTSASGLAEFLSYNSSLYEFLSSSSLGWGKTVQLATDQYHLMAMQDDGTVISKQHAFFAKIPEVSLPLADVTDIACGLNHNLILHSSGKVVVRGSPGSGVLTIPKEATNIVSLASWKHNAMVLREDGLPVVWGDGLNLPPPRTIPQEATNIVTISGGFGRAIALRDDGKLICWGYWGSVQTTNYDHVIGVSLNSSQMIVITNSGEPFFARKPSRRTWIENESHVLIASVVGEKPMTYQWQRDGVNIPNATNASIVFAAVRKSDEGLYSLRAENAFGFSSNLVAAISVTQPHLSPIIEEELTSVQVMSGTNLLLQALIRAVPASCYQWMRDGTNILGATNACLEFKNISLQEAGNYQYTAWNYLGAVTSQVAKITVEVPHQPFFGNWPEGDRCVASQQSPFKLKAYITGDPPIRVSWYHNQKLIASDTGPELSLTSLAMEDSGTYYCVATNQSGLALSSEYYLTVVPLAQWNIQGQWKNTFSEGVTNAIRVSSGYEHRLALKTDGSVVAWGNNIFGQTDVPSDLNDVIAVSAGGYHNLALRRDGSIVAWGLNDNGQTMVPDNATNIISISAGKCHSLALRADGVVLAWGDNSFGQSKVPRIPGIVIAIAAGKNHSLALTSTGSIIQWGDPSVPNIMTESRGPFIAIAAGDFFSVALNRDSSVFYSGSVYMNNSYSSMPSTWSNGDIRLSALQLGAGQGHFEAIEQSQKKLIYGMNPRVGYGTYSSIKPLIPLWLTNLYSVSPGGTWDVGLIRSPKTSRTTDMGTRYGSLGGPICINGWGTDTIARDWQWYLDGKQILDATNFFLIVSNVGPSNVGLYSLVMDRHAKVSDTMTTRLVAVMPPVPHLESIPAEHVEASAGDDLTLSVDIDATIPCNIQWRREGSNILGAMSSTLTLTNIQTVDAGDYDVVLRNASGSITCSVSHVVLNTVPPSISRQPIDWAVMKNLSASFSVTSTGSDPLRYQWYHDGEPLPGENQNRLFLENVKQSDYGVYQVGISNVYGTVESVKVNLSPVLAGGWGNNENGQLYVPASATNLVSVACGLTHAVGLRSDGTVVAWGDAAANKLNIPASATDIVAVSASDIHSLALRADGTVISWGSSYISVPNGMSNVVAVSAGPISDVALLADGTIWTWGYNTAGSIQPGFSNIIAIASGGLHFLALRRDGVVLSGGNNSAGQTNVPAAATNVIAIAAGLSSSAALRADGTVITWGTLLKSDKFSVEVIDGGYYTSTGPTLRDPILMPEEATNIIAIAMGRHHLLALRQDGILVAWGDNSAGQLNIPTRLQPIRNIMAGGLFSLVLQDSPEPQLGFYSQQQKVVFHDNITMHSAVSGRPPLSLNWFHDGLEISGATNSFLQITFAILEDAGEYTLVASNSFGATSAHIQLSVTNVPLRIIKQPTGGVFQAGDVIDLSVECIGANYPSYQWQLNGCSLNNNDTVSGVTLPTLRINKAKAMDSGHYRVMVFTDTSIIYSDEVDVRVFNSCTLSDALNQTNLTWKTGGNSPWIWQNAVSQDGVAAAESGPVGNGQNSWIETAVSGPAGIEFLYKVSSSLIWGGNLELTVDGVAMAQWSGEIGWTLFTQLVPPGDHTLRWNYSWKKPFSSGSNKAWLDHINIIPYNPIPSEIVSQPVSTTNSAGSTITFNVAVKGSTPIYYQWQFDEQNIVNATNASLVLNRTRDDQAGNYRVIISNVVNVVASSNATLTISPTPLSFLTQPASLKRANGQSAILSPVLIGSSPVLYQWYLNDNAILGETNLELCIQNLQNSNFGTYRLVASNPFGIIASVPAILDWTPLAFFGDSSRQSVADYSVSMIDLTGIYAFNTIGSDLLYVYNDGESYYFPGNYGMYFYSQQANLVDVSRLSIHGPDVYVLNKNGTAFVWPRYNVPVFLIQGLSTNVIDINAGDIDCLAVLEDGSIAKWNWEGVLDSTLQSLSHVVSVAAGAKHYLALLDDGHIQGWGDNSMGQLDIPSGLSDVVSIAAEKNVSMALLGDGTIVCWGDKSSGQLQLPEGISNCVSIALGLNHAAAILNDGSVMAWGKDSYGETHIPSSMKGVTQLQCGEYFTLCLVKDGSPAITVQPFQRWIKNGEEARFQVMVSGKGEMQYQWQLGGIDIPNATNRVLSVIGISQSNQGKYRVIVRNAIGSAISKEARLNVEETAPQAPLSLEIVRSPEVGLFIRVNGLSGTKMLRMECSTNLINWDTLWSTTPTGSTFEWSDPVLSLGSNDVTRFYRAIEQ